MEAPLSRFLVEFSVKVPMRPHEDATAFVEEDPVASEPTVTMTVAAYEEAVREAAEAAASGACAEAEAAAASRRDVERADLEGGFAAERQRWADEQGERLGASLTQAVAQLESELAAALAAALRPLLSEACRARVLGEFAAAVDAVLSDPGRPSLRIEGPADLLGAFGAAHASDLSIDYVASEDATELTLITDATRIETRLGACLAKLAS